MANRGRDRRLPGRMPVVPDSGRAPSAAGRRRTLRRDRPRDARERRLGDHPLRRPQVLRKAAFPALDDGARIRRLRGWRMAGPALGCVQRRCRAADHGARHAPLVRPPRRALRGACPPGGPGLEPGESLQFARHGSVGRDDVRARRRADRTASFDHGKRKAPLDVGVVDRDGSRGADQGAHRRRTPRGRADRLFGAVARLRDLAPHSPAERHPPHAGVGRALVRRGVAAQPGVREFLLHPRAFPTLPARPSTIATLPGGSSSRNWPRGSCPGSGCHAGWRSRCATSHAVRAFGRPCSWPPGR